MAFELFSNKNLISLKYFLNIFVKKKGKRSVDTSGMWDIAKPTTPYFLSKKTLPGRARNYKPKKGA